MMKGWLTLSFGKIIMAIISKLKGVIFTHIIDSIRDQEVADKTFKRSLLLDFKDLHNISRDFNIDYATK